MGEQLSGRVRGALWGYLLLQVLLAASGIVLLAAYRGASAVDAAEAFRASQGAISWRLLAGLHYWGSFAALTVGPALLAALFLQGVRDEARRMWLPTLLSLGLCLALQITGNALPADRHDVRTVNVEASIASRAPVIGESLGRIVLQGSEFSGETLNFWRLLHAVLGVSAVAVLIWQFLLLRKVKPKSGSEIGIALAVPALSLLAAIVFPRATGEPFTDADRASFMAQPSWYVTPMHSMLKLFESLDRSLGWVGAMLLPGLAGLAAVMAPLWVHRLSLSARKALLFSAVAAIGLVIGFFGSAPAPVSGDQPVHEMSAGQSGGPVVKSLSQAGAQLYDEHCSGCHGKGGAGSPSAPKLTDVHKTNTDPDFYVRFLRDPKSINASSTMPAFSHLSEEQLRALAEWLRDAERE